MPVVLNVLVGRAVKLNSIAEAQRPYSTPQMREAQDLTQLPDGTLKAQSRPPFEQSEQLISTNRS